MCVREREKERERDESCSRPAELVISFFHHLEVLALKWFVATEQIRNAPFMLSRSVSKFQNLRSSFEIHLGLGLKNKKCRLKKIFHFVNEFS